ncbi:MAG TPA: hypothetical protein VGX78_23135 [Pirellulales bacterium]|jgi:hypothetical protein|nr:hypothetical protein [Pirellulales bacterium]
MKTIAISARAKTLNDLLKKARRGTIILKSADGQRYALTSINDWEAFDVGNSDDFAREVERTGKNKRLMKSLAARRKSGKAKGIPLVEVKRQMGLD